VTRTALILQHDPSIHLGNIGPVLVEHGYDLRIVDVTAEDVAAIDPEVSRTSTVTLAFRTSSGN